MARGLRDKLVLVTGASTGIGRAAALRFGSVGARVVAVSRSEERLDTLVAELGGEPRAVAVPADVTDPDAMERMASRVLERCGAPDVLVANAGLGVDARFVESTDELWHQVLEVNVLGVVRTVRPFLPGMQQRGSGRVLLISSVVGKRGIPNYAAYSASKFALHGMADALRPELWGDGISVGLVCPSSTESEFHERKLHRGPRQPETRLARHSADSVARAIVRMARSRRREIVLSPEGKAMTFFNRLVPGLLDRLLHRVLVKKQEKGTGKRGQIY